MEMKILIQIRNLPKMLTSGNNEFDTYLCRNKKCQKFRESAKNLPLNTESRIANPKENNTIQISVFRQKITTKQQKY